MKFFIKRNGQIVEEEPPVNFSISDLTQKGYHPTLQSLIEFEQNQYTELRKSVEVKLAAEQLEVEKLRDALNSMQSGYEEWIETVKQHRDYSRYAQHADLPK